MIFSLWLVIKLHEIVSSDVRLCRKIKKTKKYKIARNTLKNLA